MDPLLIAGLQPDGTHTGSNYSRAVQRGQLLRLRRGVYVRADIWLHSYPSQRYQLVLAATDQQLQNPVFCRESALIVHHLPLLDLPSDIHVRASSRGAVRTVRQPSLTGGLSAVQFWDRAASLGAAEGLSFSAAPFRGFSTARHVPVQGRHAMPQRRDLLLAYPGAPDGQQLKMAVRTDPLDFAVVDTVPRMGFDAAVVTLDAALRRAGPQHAAEAGHLQQLGGQVLSSERMTSYFHDLLSFATPLSESPGESLARARFHQLGFDQPQLQASMSVDGISYRVDFLWEEAGVVGEFDGWKKYDGDGFAQSLKQEKIREDAIRSTGYVVVRFYWEDLMEPGCARLIRLLTRAGIPRHTVTWALSHHSS